MSHVYVDMILEKARNHVLIIPGPTRAELKRRGIRARVIKFDDGHMKVMLSSLRANLKAWLVDNGYNLEAHLIWPPTADEVERWDPLPSPLSRQSPLSRLIKLARKHRY